LLAANIWLADQPFYSPILWGQAVFYGLALVMAFVPARSGLWRALRLSTMFTSMNLALLTGFFRWLTGRQRAAWQRTERLVEVPVATQ
jgi:hypothetical protein